MKRLFFSIALILTLFGFSFKSVFAEPGRLDEFAYHKAFYVNGSSSGAVTDYPVKLTLDIGEGQDTSSTLYLDHHVLSSFNDIRFSSDGKLTLSYWIESSTSTTATVWVKLDSVPAAPSQKTFYIYYGNSSMPSRSDGSHTFSFYDGFDTDGISSWTGSNQNLHSGETATQSINSTTYFSAPNSADLYTYANCTHEPWDGVGSILTHSVNLPSSSYKVDFSVSSDITGFLSGTTANERSFVLVNGSVGYSGVISCTGLDCTTSTAWGTPKSFDVVNSPITSISLKAYADDCTHGNVYFDNVRIRNFINPEPALTLTSNQDDSTSTNSSSTPEGYRAPSCTDSKPVSIPDLFQIDAIDTSAKLFFTPIDYNQYFISFSTKPNAEEFGEAITLTREGVQSHNIYLLKPNTTYYVKVRGQNGCMPGDWSSVMKIKTNSKNQIKQNIFYKYFDFLKKIISPYQQF